MLALSGCVYGRERKKMEVQSMKLKDSRWDTCLRLVVLLVVPVTISYFGLPFLLLFSFILWQELVGEMSG
ncbi:unnamed protein product [Prunus brigantina]